MATINDMPNEILYKIFPYINIFYRQYLRTVCKRWQCIIRHMWRSERKLKFTVRPRNVLLENVSYDQITRGYIARRIHFISTVLSPLGEILKLTDGNLTELTIFHRGSEPEIPIEILELLRQNKHLTTLRLSAKKPETFMHYLRCIPTENLDHLSLVFYGSPVTKEIHFIDDINNVLLGARSLTFLELNQISPLRLRIIGTMHTLKSLHISDCTISLRSSKLLLNITRLHNLEKLRLEVVVHISDIFLIELAKNCQKLRALHFLTAHMASNVGFKAIGTLPNLRYFHLIGYRWDSNIPNCFEKVKDFECVLDKYSIFHPHYCLFFNTENEDLVLKMSEI